MNCMICGSAMEYYFSKNFDVFNLKRVDYWKCTFCGFCASKTHLEMSTEEWNQLNNDFHSDTHFRTDNPYNRNQRYFHQALMLSILAKSGLLEQTKWVDWGSGIGAVAILLDKFFDLKLHTYDKYFVPKINVLSESELTPRHFNLVVSTAVFEHIRDRKTLDEIESFVSTSGAFAIHTLVPENVPQDPQWMYLLPVHCAFHTNKSMEILMQEWGYTCSAYNEHSKMWVLFKKKSKHVMPILERINTDLGWDYLHFKSGFTDYWK